MKRLVVYREKINRVAIFGGHHVVKTYTPTPSSVGRIMKACESWRRFCDVDDNICFEEERNGSQDKVWPVGSEVPEV